MQAECLERARPWEYFHLLQQTKGKKPCDSIQTPLVITNQTVPMLKKTITVIKRTKNNVPKQADWLLLVK